MVNSLVITCNINFTKKLLDEINSNCLDIRIGGIKTTYEEALLTLSSSDFELIFLDRALEKDFSNSFIEKYKEKLVILSYKDFSNLLNPRILKNLKFLVNRIDLDNKKTEIINELKYIGYKLNYRGTQYLIDAILHTYVTQDTMNNTLQSHIYPIIAKKYNKTILNVKSSITKATECMYYACDTKKLSNYFQFSCDSKPTTKQIIYAVINNI